MKSAKHQNLPKGRLIVFEGPDEVGKTTTSKLLAEEIFRRGRSCIWQAFPGHDPGTLGAEVYALHHDSRFDDLPALSVQLLHVAAHIDAVHRRILPALASGTWVVLDRYWWSTLIYGLSNGVKRAQLQRALDLEIIEWKRVVPSVVFLFERELHSLDHSIAKHLILQKHYRRLARVEQRRYPVAVIKNEGTIEDALRKVLAITFEFESDQL